LIDKIILRILIIADQIRVLFDFDIDPFLIKKERETVTNRRLRCSYEHVAFLEGKHKSSI